MNVFDIFIFSVNAIMPMIFLILLGYFLKIKGVISKDFIKIGNKVVFKICLPVLLFTNVASIEGIDRINFGAIIYVLSIIAVLVIIGFIIQMFIPERKQKGVVLQCIFRSNFALIGVPLAELISGSEGVAAAAILSVFTIPIYNIIAVVVLTIFVGDSDKGAIKKQIKAIAKNPLIIGVLSGVVVMLIKGVIPSSVLISMSHNLAFVPSTLSYISRMATPLALLVLGGQFEFSSVKGYRNQIVVATFCRIILAPMIGLGVAAVLNKLGILYFEPAIFAAFISLFGTPVAVSSAIMAEAMDNDGQLAAQLVVWTSLFSMVTLFGFIFLCRMLGLV